MRTILQEPNIINCHTKVEIFRAWEAKIKEYEARLFADVESPTGRKATTLYVLKGGHTPARIECWNIEGRYVSYMDVRVAKPFVNRHATDKQIEQIKDYYRRIQKSVRKTYSYILKRTDGYGIEHTNVYLYDVDGKSCAYSPEELSEALKAKQEEYEQFYMPRDGYTPCAYCGKQVPNDRLVRKDICFWRGNRDFNRITGRWENKRVFVTEEKAFCSEQCADHEQCAMED